MFIFGHICPTWSTITSTGIYYVCVLAGWIVMCIGGIPMSVASVLALAACPLGGYFTADDLMASSMGSSYTVLIIFIFVLVYAFEETRTGEFLVRWVLSRKSINGKPYLFTAMFLLVIIVIGSIIGSFGIIMLAIAVLENLCLVSGMKQQSDYIRFLLFSVVALSGITEALFPFRPFALLYSGIFNDALAQYNMAISDIGYLSTSLIIAIVDFVLLLAVGRFILKPDMSQLKSLDVTTLQTEEFKKMSLKQIIVLVIVLVSFFHPFIVEILPEGSSLYAFLNTMGQPLFMGFMVALLCLVRIGGKPILNPAVAFTKGVNWNVTFGMGAVLTVGAAVSAEKSGFSSWLLSLLGGMFDSMGVIPIIIIVALLSCVVTQFFNNATAAVILSTVLAAASGTLLATGVDVSIFPAIITVGTFSACLLPCSSGQSAIMLGTKIFEGSEGQRWALTKGMVILTAVVISVMTGGVVRAIL